MKQRQNVLDYDDLLLYFAQMLTEPAIAAGDRRPLRSPAGRRIPGHQRSAGRNRAALEAARAGPDGRRRRRAGDLFVPRRDGAQHSRFSARLRSAGARRHARAQLPLDAAPILAAANAVIALAPERFAKNLWTDRPRGALPLLVDRRRRRRSGALRRDPRARQSRGGRFAQKPGGAVSRLPPQRRARTRADPPQRAVRQIRRPEVSRRRACERRGRALRFAENPRDRVAGFRVAQLLPGVGPKIAETIVAAAAADDGFAAMAALIAAGAGARRLSRLRRPHAPARRPRRAVAGGDRRRRRLALAAHRDALRRRARPDGRSRGARAHRRLVPLARALLERARARSAGRDQRRSRPAA